MLGLRPHRHSCAHSVLFYRDDETVRERVATYVTSALRAGRPALVIARPALANELMIEVHRQHIQGMPFGARRGRLVTMDAERTLSSFSIEGRPDPSLFREIIGEALASLGGTSDSPVAAYGEMVGVLCERGQYADAILLENMWNELLADAHASLYCGYPRRLFVFPAAQPFLEAIRAAHTEAEDEAYAPA
jgi:hypothetical protein